MPDLRTLMHDAAPAVPTAVDPEADLARGRTALRRHRTARLTTGSGLVAALAVGAFAVSGLGSDPAVVPRGTTALPPAPATATADLNAGTALVAYTGKQPHGFVLDSVPEGWVVQGSTPTLITIAPKGTADKDPMSFKDKISITLSADVAPDLSGSSLRIGGRPAVVQVMDDGDATSVYVKETQGYLTIQVFNNLGWDQSRMIEFARGVHVTQDAQLSHG